VVTIPTTQKPELMYKYFIGWSENADKSTVDYLPGSTLVMKKDITLYAVYSNTNPNTYTLTIDINGGTIQSDR